jgi:hypothetical protein
MVACLFKYYGVFFWLSIVAFDFLRTHRIRKKTLRVWLPDLFSAAIYAGTPVIPAVLYIFYFLKIGIPNPISEYIQNDGHGHFGSLRFIFSWAFVARCFTWNCIKGPTVVFGIFGIIGGIFSLRQKDEPALLLKCLFVGAAAFAACFAHSYFVHDYYAIQNTLLWALMAGAILSVAFRRNVITQAVIFAVAVLSQTYVHSATYPQPYYQQAARVLKEKAQGPGFWIAERSGIVSLYESGLTAWTVGPDQWNGYSNFHQATDQLLHGDRLHWVGLLFVDGDLTAREKEVRARLEREGWKNVIAEEAFDSHDSRVPNARMVLLSR